MNIEAEAADDLARLLESLLSARGPEAHAQPPASAERETEAVTVAFAREDAVDAVSATDEIEPGTTGANSPWFPALDAVWASFALLRSIPARAVRAVVPAQTAVAGALVADIFHRLMGDLPVSYMSFALALRVLEACTARVLPFPRLLSAGAPLAPTSHATLQHARRRMRFASAAYGWKMLYGLGVAGGSGDVAASLTLDSREADLAAALRHTALRREDVLDYRTASSAPLGDRTVLLPGFVLARDSATQCVVLALRGTMSAEESAIDLACEPTAFLDSTAHEGMASAALWFATVYRPTLAAALADSPIGTRLELTGHSLGAGVAILLALLLDREAPELGPVRCVAFGPPCVVAPGLACSERARALIDAFVLGDDLVCSLSLSSLANLRAVVVRLASDPRHSSLNRLVQMLAGPTGGEPGSLAGMLAQVTATELAFVPEDLVTPLHPEPISLLPGGSLHFLCKPIDRATGVRAAHYRAACAHPLAFSELRVTPSMMADHLPSAYEYALDDALVWYPRDATPIDLVRGLPL